MKLYDAVQAPNPRRVHIFLREKGLTVPTQSLDIMALEHKGEAFAAVNPRQRLPVLELDDGTVICETIAICRYFEELQPEPALFGRGAVGKASVEMWQRRLEFEFLMPILFAFRHSRRSMAKLEIPQIPEWAEANKVRAREFMMFLNHHLADKAFVCGAEYSVADITGLVALETAAWARVDVPSELSALRRWWTDISARPSAGA